MQPRSQPRYGLILASIPTSGLWFVVMTLLARSRKNRVGTDPGGPSSGSASISSGTKRLGGFLPAPRPRGAGGRTGNAPSSRGTYSGTMMHHVSGGIGQED